MRVMVVLNVDSGSIRGRDIDATETQLGEALAAAGQELVAIRRTDRPIDDVLNSIDVDSFDTLLVVGGDGSVSAAGAFAWRSNRVLSILPGGTMNFYARTLGLPMDLDEAIDALGARSLHSVDIATANGRAFLHQFTFGLHANAVRLREGARYRSRVGKLLATTRAFVVLMIRPRHFTVLIEEDKQPAQSHRLSALAISNNRFGEGHMPYADRPDGGVLGVYCSEPVQLGSALRLMLDIMRGRHRSNPHVSSSTAKRVCLNLPRPYDVGRALIDGELLPIESSIEIEMHAGALKVLIPPQNGQTT